MRALEVCVVAQVCLTAGLAGLFWPDRFMPLFDVLLFPWTASYRMIRAHSVAAIVLSLLLVAGLLAG